MTDPLRDKLRALAERGVGTDLTPTRLRMDPEADLWWCDYLQRLDQSWRERIESILDAEQDETCGCPDSRDCCEADADLTPVTGGLNETVEVVGQAEWNERCTGAGDCTFTPHIHGCYADVGDCNDPADHLALTASPASVPDDDATTACMGESPSTPTPCVRCGRMESPLRGICGCPDAEQDETGEPGCVAGLHASQCQGCDPDDCAHTPEGQPEGSERAYTVVVAIDHETHLGERSAVRYVASSLHQRARVEVEEARDCDNVGCPKHCKQYELRARFRVPAASPEAAYRKVWPIVSDLVGGEPLAVAVDGDWTIGESAAPAPVPDDEVESWADWLHNNADPTWHSDDGGGEHWVDQRVRDLAELLATESVSPDAHAAVMAERDRLRVQVVAVRALAEEHADHHRGFYAFCDLCSTEIAYNRILAALGEEE